MRIGKANRRIESPLSFKDKIINAFSRLIIVLMELVTVLKEKKRPEQWLFEVQRDRNGRIEKVKTKALDSKKDDQKPSLLG